jgi:hypothetical protein
MKYSKPRHAGWISTMVRGRAANRTVRGTHAPTDTLKSGLLTRGAFRSWTITSWIRVRFSGVRLMLASSPPHPGRSSRGSRGGGQFSLVPVLACSAPTNGSSDLPGALDPSCGSAAAHDSVDRRAAPGRSYGFARSAQILEAARPCRAPAPSWVRPAGPVDPRVRPARSSRCGRDLAVR